VATGPGLYAVHDLSGLSSTDLGQRQLDIMVALIMVSAVDG
jgi:hypothetical protein